jgi:hypothetical protein
MYLAKGMSAASHTTCLLYSHQILGIERSRRTDYSTDKCNDTFKLSKEGAQKSQCQECDSCFDESSSRSPIPYGAALVVRLFFCRCWQCRVNPNRLASA